MVTTTAESEILKTVIGRRHSTRAFLPEPVPDELIDEMFALAQGTPSWCNVQPWQVSLLSGEAARDFGVALTAHAAEHKPEPDFELPKGFNGVYNDRRRQSGFALYGSLGIAREDMPARNAQMLRNFSFFDAPHVAIISTDSDLGVFGAIDCGLYLSTLLLAGESLGISTIPQAALALHPGFMREYLGLGEDRLIVAGVSFGREDTEHPANSYRVPREDIAKVVERVDRPARA